MFHTPIKKLIHCLLPVNNNQATVYTQKEHKINKNYVSRNAIKVCETLQKKGFEAYLVGGAVRDLLLHIEPKDFDVATNATPNQIRKCFRRSHIIGRRFKIVHILFGSEIIETTTFRQTLTQENTDEFGRLLEDNQYGNLEEDADRRDFTINALYYDPVEEVVLDFHNGFKDLQKRIIRIIGKPKERYREDPVRMLRALRFSAKLNATLDKHTAKPIPTLAPLLKNIPTSRMIEEGKKIIFSGNMIRCIELLEDYDIPLEALPGIDLIHQHIQNNDFLKLTLERTDHRVRSHQPINLGFLYAAVLWRPLNLRWQSLTKNTSPLPALIQASNEVIEKYTRHMALMKSHSSLMRDIWLSQVKFDKPKARFIWKLIDKPYFRAACDFLQLRAAAGEFDSELAQWWMDVANEEDLQARNQLIEQGLKKDFKQKEAIEHKKSRRRRRRRKNPKRMVKTNENDQSVNQS